VSTTTFEELRQGFGRYLGYGEEMGKDGTAWTTTTNVGSNQNVISTELGDYGFRDPGDAGSGDDLFGDWWVKFNSGNNDDEVRRIASYDASASRLVVSGSVLEAESGAVDFELHKWSPTLLREVLNTARLHAQDILYLPTTRTLFTSPTQTRFSVPSIIIGRPTDISLVKRVPAGSYADNILSNGDFEDFTGGAPDSWAATTLDTAQEDASTNPYNYVVFDGKSVRLTSQNGNTGTLLQTISSPGTHSGQRITLSIWVYCLTASIVSTRITINGSINLGTAIDGGLHTGSGWELLTHYEDAPVTITALTVGLSVLSSATDNTEFYADEAISVVGPLQEPEYSEIPLADWEFLPQMQGSTLRNEVIFGGPLPNMHLLRFRGRGFLSSVSSDTDIMEIDSDQAQLLYAYAAAELFSRQSFMAGDVDWRFTRAMEDKARRDIVRLEPVGTKGPPRRFQPPM
jgi:hypothetical protein